MRIGTWNVTSLYRTGAVRLVARELDKYRLDLIGVQEVRLYGNGISPVGEYYGKGNNNHLLGTGFLYMIELNQQKRKLNLLVTGCHI